jgi:hypothetical protein
MLVLVNMRIIADMSFVFSPIHSNCLENLEQYVLQTSCVHLALKDVTTNIDFFFIKKTGNTYQVLEKVALAHLDHFWGLLVFFLHILQFFLVFIISYN